MQGLFSGVIPIVLIVIGVLLVVSMLLRVYRTVPQDKAGVVTGVKKRVITGGGGIVLPFFERIDFISLGNITLNVKTTNSLSSQGVPINVRTTAVVKVQNKTESILTAIEQFIGRNEQEIAKNISDTAISVLEGKLREIIAGMTVEDLYNEREKFRSKVQEVVGAEFAGMGLEVKNFTITDISDDNGYIEAMGEGRIAERRRDSEIQKAEAKRDQDIKVAAAEQEGEIARISKEKAIAEAEKDKSVQDSQFKEEMERARAVQEKAFETQTNISEKDVAQAQADLELVRKQREKEVKEAEIQVEIVAEEKSIELAQKQAERAKAQLHADVVVPAEAEKEKKREEAEARKIEEIAEAEAKAEAKKLDADADAEAVLTRAKANAEATRLEGEAVADAIKAKGIAEAEALERKAEAQAKMGQASITEMVVNILPQIAESVAKPFESIDKISIIGGGDSNGVEQVASYVPIALKKVVDAVEETTGFDLLGVMEAQTIKGLTDKNVNISGLDVADAGNSDVVAETVEEEDDVL